MKKGILLNFLLRVSPAYGKSVKEFLIFLTCVSRLREVSEVEIFKNLL